MLYHQAAFAVTPFLGDITPFSKPGCGFGNYAASLGRSFTVVNMVGSRPAFRVSSVVIRSAFTNVKFKLDRQRSVRNTMCTQYDTLGAATVTVIIPQAVV